MKFFVDNWILVLVACVSGGMLLWPVIRGGGRATLSTAQAVQLMNREKAVVIDVSEPAEYAAGHVAGSRNVPAGNIGSAKPVNLILRGDDPDALARANESVMAGMRTLDTIQDVTSSAENLTPEVHITPKVERPYGLVNA